MLHEWAYCPHCGGSPEGPDGDGYESAGTSPADTADQVETTEPATAGDQANARGVECYQAGQMDDAVRCFEAAIREEPVNSRYWVNLGVALGEKGDDLGAYAAYVRAIEINPREIQAHLNVGYLHMERERTAEAREAWERVVSLAPESEEAAEARENLQNAEEL